MNLKNVLLVLFLVVFNSCALSLKVGEKSYPTNPPNLINTETLSYSQLRWKLRTDFRFRYDYAQYAISQSQSFDWNNPLLNNRYNFYNPYLGYSYFRNSEDRVIKPRIIRTNPTPIPPVIRNNPPNRNIRNNPPSRPVRTKTSKTPTRRKN